MFRSGSSREQVVSARWQRAHDSASRFDRHDRPAAASHRHTNAFQLVDYRSADDRSFCGRDMRSSVHPCRSGTRFGIGFWWNDRAWIPDPILADAFAGYCRRRAAERRYHERELWPGPRSLRISRASGFASSSGPNTDRVDGETAGPVSAGAGRCPAAGGSRQPSPRWNLAHPEDICGYNAPAAWARYPSYRVNRAPMQAISGKASARRAACAEAAVPRMTRPLMPWKMAARRKKLNAM